MGFLQTHGFDEKPVERDPVGTWLRKSYVGRHVAFEFILDLREQVYESKVSQVKNGALTNEFAVDAGGSVVRGHLREFLRSRGLSDDMLQKVGKLPFVEYFKARIEEDAKFLQEFGGDILADSTRIFGDLPNHSGGRP